MTCTKCGEKPEKNCEAFPKAVVEINNPEKIVLFRKVVVPASMGGRDALPPAIGKYHNVLLEYEADGSLFLYSSDGIPTQLSTEVTDLQRQLDALGIEVDNERVERIAADEGLSNAIEEEVDNRQNADTALSNQITDLDDSLATVARTGSYNDLSNKPTIGNGTLTVKRNGTNIGTFRANATTNTDINVPVPTKTSNLVNDGSDGASQYVESDDLATVATSGSYNDLTNKPTIGNATLTIKRNNTNAGTFTANATTNKSINIAVPTKTSDLTNDGSDGTSAYVETRNLPTIGNATLTITENNTPAGTFTANATSNKTINITSPTKTSDLTNDGADGTSTYVESDDLPTVDTTYSSSSNNAIANSTVTNSLDRNVMTDLTLDSTPSTTTVNLNNTKTNLAYPSSSTTSSISLPVASSTQAGVMNSATFDAIASNTSNINAILSGAVAITGLPASPTQAELTTAWENETGLTSLMNRAGIYDVTNSKVWTYYTNDNTWYAASNTSQVTVSTFTNSSEGLIKGSTNDGQVFAENDGTGSVNGWDTLTSAVSSNTSKLATIAQGAEVNVQANWTQTNTNADDYIKNKPANLVQDANYVHTDNNFTTALKDKLNGISAGAEVNVQADWTQTNTSADDYIKNKPANLVQDANYVHTDNNFTTTLKNKLDGIESGAEVNVQADWAQSNTSADDYIKNKPTIPTVNNATLTIQKNGSNIQTFTANSSTNKTANITVPTAVSELTNDADYATNTALNAGLATKQNTLTAGNNITITGDTISATDTTYTAGNAISIENGVISADVHPADFFDADEDVSDCGSTVNLSETVDSTIKSIELHGDTEQQTYSGINLLPPPEDFTQDVNGLIITCSNGEYSINGNASSGATTGVKSTIAEYTIKAGDYFHYNNDLVSSRINIGLRFSDSTQFATSMNVANRIISLEDYVGKTVIGVTVNFNSGYDFSGTAKPMILSGVSTVTPFEPYVGGVPAPNPDYPQEIHTVTGEQTVSVTSKNLFSGYTKGINLSPTDGSQTRSSVAACSDYIPLDITGTNTFTISGLPTTLFNFVAAYNANKVFLGRTGAGGFAERTLSSNSFTGGTPQGSGDIAYIRVPIYENASVPGVISDIDNAKIQLEAGPTATDYQPYQSQTYEINLGKNLLELANYTAGGVTTTLNSDGKITVSGTTANNYANFMAYQTPLSSPSGTYTFSRTGDNTYRVSLTLFSEDKSQNTSINIAAGSNSATATIPFEIGYVAGAYTSLTVGSELNFTTGLQLEFGSTATSYAPYFAPIELRKLGDYQDYIYKGADGWYLHKEVERVVFNGTETWGQVNSYAYFSTQISTDIIRPSNIYSKPLILSDYYSPASRSNLYDSVVDYGIGAHENTPSRILIRNKDYTSIPAFTTWLSNHNTTVYYALATPTDTQIMNETLVGQLDALSAMRSYNDQTNIIVAATSNNLPATLCVTTYRKSLDGVLDLINDTACTCKNRQGNLVVNLPNGMTTYTDNDAPIPISEVIEAFKRGQSVFLVDLLENIYVVTAADMDDGIYSMRADQTGIGPRKRDGHWHINGGGDVWTSVTFINDATPDDYLPIFSDATWTAFTSSTPLLDQYRRTYYPASSNVRFNNGQETVSVAELWAKLASSSFDGNPVVLRIPLQRISTLTTSLVDTGFSADSPYLTINVSLGPDNYFERETSEHTITGWAAECTPITFDGKEAHTVGIVRVVEGGNTTYSFVVSLTEVENPIG